MKKKAPEELQDNTTEESSFPSEQVAPLPQAAKKESPPSPQGPVVVDKLDRLEAENLNLRLLATQSREVILQHQLNDVGREKDDLVQKIHAMRARLEDKYNINLATHHVQPDSGVVVPRPNMTPQQLAAAQRQQG